MWRQIQTSRLLASGIGYRAILILTGILFCKFGLKTVLAKLGPVAVALIWNTINTCIYYLYHYTFLRMFKIGKGEK